MGNGRSLILAAMLTAAPFCPTLAAANWYYCDPAKAYYPYVQTCPTPWREVVPFGSAAQPQAPAQTARPWVAPIPSSPAPAPVLAPSSPPASAAFGQGAADRQAWETWFSGLTGDYLAGASYWAAHRSLPAPPACNAPPPAMGADWTPGCFAAQQRLAPADVRRKTEPEYRLGWNSYQASATAAPTVSAVPPPTPSPSATPPVASAPAASLDPSVTPAPAGRAPADGQPPAVVAPPDAEDHQPAPTKSDAVAEKPQSDGGECEKNWQQCRDNKDLADNAFEFIEARAACKVEADEQARFGTPIWPGFWSGGAFANYRPGTDYVATGVVVAIEPNAQFQNGFGAMVHSTVICRYDLRAKKVLDVAILPH